MGLFDIFKREKDQEQRTLIVDSSLEAFLNQKSISKKQALEIPTFSGGIDLIANVIASTPIKLYKDVENKAQEETNDYRLKFLNQETGDILTSNAFWKAIVIDYFTGLGGYAYINRKSGKITSLHYVDEEKISVTESTDPIYKNGNIFVNGIMYHDFDFIKVLRNTKNGLSGKSLIDENQSLLAVGYYSLMLETKNLKRGGIKKGFLKTETKQTDESIAAMKTSFNKLYSEDRDNFIVLNKGVEFQESSSTQVEMQLSQNKSLNALEFARLFHISPDVICGNTSDTKTLAKIAAIPIMKTIEAALNQTILLEREKDEYYFAFDTKELLKGEMQERFNAYKTALDANFMQIDEVRYAEDLPALGLSWIKIGLQDVLYDPKTKMIYTPNTNKTSSMDGNVIQQEPRASGYNPNRKSNDNLVVDLK